jgi:hypothetical protein
VKLVDGLVRIALGLILIGVAAGLGSCHNIPPPHVKVNADVPEKLVEKLVDSRRESP